MRKFGIYFFLSFLTLKSAVAVPIYFPETESKSGMLQLKSNWFSFGAEFEGELLVPQGDNDLSFDSSEGVSHDNRDMTKFRVDKLTLIPQIFIKDILSFYGEIQAYTDRNTADTTVLREAHLTLQLPWNLFLKFGIEDRLLSPEFSALNEAEGANKRLTEAYPINGTAFWEDEDLGFIFGGDHPIQSNLLLFWKASVTNGLSVDDEEITRNQIYPILHDDRHVQSLNVDLTAQKELGLGLGIRHHVSENFQWSFFGFGFANKLQVRDITFLQAVITGYTSASDTNNMGGANVDIGLFGFNLFSQYVYARDGQISRDGFYVQPSYYHSFGTERRFLSGARLLYRYNWLDVRTRSLADNIAGSPFTWDRETHTAALNIHIHQYVTLRNEFHLNLEQTGGNPGRVSNNEFLTQLEIRF